jgi:hypothetical protein
MRRADFTVDSVGDLTHLYVDPDPLDLGDPGVPDGHNLLYSSGDVWGNSTHDELYLVLRRVYDDLDRGGTHTILIYDLNNLANNRELFRSEDNPNGWISNWDCPPGVSHPQAFAECYRPEALKWNPTGTAIYMRDTLRPSDTPEISSYWYAALRLKIPRGGPSTLISTWNWDISAPQIVFTGTATETAGDPGGIAVMPRPGVAGVSDLLFEDGSPGGILDVELCIGLFTPPLNDPDPEIGADHWVNCLIDNDPYTGLSYDLGNAGRGSWLSSSEILHDAREKRRLVSIYRTNIYDGVSTKIIDDAEDPDTGN